MQIAENDERVRVTSGPRARVLRGKRVWSERKVLVLRESGKRVPRRKVKAWNGRNQKPQRNEQTLCVNFSINNNCCFGYEPVLLFVYRPTSE